MQLQKDELEGKKQVKDMLVGVPQSPNRNDEKPLRSLNNVGKPFDPNDTQEMKERNAVRDQYMSPGGLGLYFRDTPSFDHPFQKSMKMSVLLGKTR